MTILDHIKMYSDFAPLYIYGKAFLSATGDYGKGLAIIDGLNFLCGKTASVDDDRIARDIEAVLKSEEGKRLFDHIVEIIRREQK
jgi:hypothetical protein